MSRTRLAVRFSLASTVSLSGWYRLAVRGVPSGYQGQNARNALQHWTSSHFAVDYLEDMVERRCDALRADKKRSETRRCRAERAFALQECHDHGATTDTTTDTTTDATKGRSWKGSWLGCIHTPYQQRSGTAMLLTSPL
jgi:hypothetical protein